MEVMFFIGFLAFISSIGYLLYHFIRKIKNKNRSLPKGKFFTALIGSFLMVVIGGANMGELDYSSMQELSETNALLVEENEAYQQKVADLEEESATYQKEIETLSLQITESEKREEEHLEKISAHEEKISNLERKNIAFAKNETVLNNKIEELEQKNTVAAAPVQTTTSAPNKTATNSATTQPVAKSEPVKQDCNIKGSNSGIYHTPSSSYYNRTTNVARWFCSEQEAINAGYRAPKR